MLLSTEFLECLSSLVHPLPVQFINLCHTTEGVDCLGGCLVGPLPVEGSVGGSAVVSVQRREGERC